MEDDTIYSAQMGENCAFTYTCIVFKLFIVKNYTVVGPDQRCVVAYVPQSRHFSPRCSEGYWC